MMDVLDVVVRASIVMMAALLAAIALRRGSAALRHLVLAAGIFTAAAVIPLSVMLPGWNLPAQPRSVAEPMAATIVGTVMPSDRALAAPSPLARIPVERLGAALWGVGVAITMLPVVVGFARLRRLTRKATPITDARWLGLKAELSALYGVRRPVALLKTTEPGVLATCGVRRPRVLLPSHCESWSDARIRIVLSHELAHVRRDDWIIQVAAEIVLAVFWCSPPFWIARTRLRRESEQACDDSVIEGGVAADVYAWHLVEIARACRPYPSLSGTVMPIARPSTLEWRIAAMLNPTISRCRPTRRTMAVAFAVLVGVTLPVASFRVTAQDDPRPLTGSVYDMSGAVLPQVVVILKDAAGVKRESTTDASGTFAFEPVAPGSYGLTTSLIGFLPLKQDLTLTEARNWQRAITLQVGQLEERVTVTEQRPASAAVAPGREAVRVGGNIRAPRKIVHMAPVYPPAMRDAGFEGVVPMEAHIGLDGKVVSVRMISTQVHPELANAAVDAVRQWEFSPTLLNGAAVEVFMAVTVEFKLPV